MVFIVAIIILVLVLMGVVCWVAMVGVAAHDTAMRSKAKKLALALGYSDYRDAVMRLGLAKTRSYRAVPPAEVFHALQNEQYHRSAHAPQPGTQLKCSKCYSLVSASVADCPRCGHQGRVKV